MPGMKETGIAWKLLSLSLSEIICPIHTCLSQRKGSLVLLRRNVTVMDILSLVPKNHTGSHQQEVNKIFLFSSDIFFLAVISFRDGPIPPFKILDVTIIMQGMKGPEVITYQYASHCAKCPIKFNSLIPCSNPFGINIISIYH